MLAPRTGKGMDPGLGRKPCGPSYDGSSSLGQQEAHRGAKPRASSPCTARDKTSRHHSRAPSPARARPHRLYQALCSAAPRCGFWASGTEEAGPPLLPGAAQEADTPCGHGQRPQPPAWARALPNARALPTVPTTLSTALPGIWGWLTGTLLSCTMFPHRVSSKSGGIDFRGWGVGTGRRGRPLWPHPQCVAGPKGPTQKHGKQGAGGQSGEPAPIHSLPLGSSLFCQQPLRCQQLDSRAVPTVYQTMSTLLV